jgi:ribosomal protein S5
MAEMRQRRESRAGDELEEIVVKVKRCAKVVKGGKRFSFNALVVVGDRKGRVGWGYGKANEVPFAVNKGIQEGKKKLIAVPIIRTTIPHQVREKHGATSVILLPPAKAPASRPAPPARGAGAGGHPQRADGCSAARIDQRREATFGVSAAQDDRAGRGDPRRPLRESRSEPPRRRLGRSEDRT